MFINIYRDGREYIVNSIFVFKKNNKYYSHLSLNSGPIQMLESGGLYFLNIDDLIEFEDK